MAHGGSQGDGVVGQEGHEEGGQGRGKGRGHHDGAEVHARQREDRRLDEEDVGHGHEGGGPPYNLLTDRRSVSLQSKEPLQHQSTICRLVLRGA